jgi:hypothetical protein
VLAVDTLQAAGIPREQISVIGPYDDDVGVVLGTGVVLGPVARLRAPAACCQPSSMLEGGVSRTAARVDLVAARVDDRQVSIAHEVLGVPFRLTRFRRIKTAGRGGPYA